MTSRGYAFTIGFLLPALALGEFLNQRSGSAFVASIPWLTTTHALVGIAGLASYLTVGHLARSFAQLVGLAALGVAILGFLPAHADTLASSILGAPVPMLETVIHLLVGVGGVFAGFGGSRDE